MLHFVDLLLFHLSTRPITSELSPWLNKLSRNCIREGQKGSIRCQDYLRFFLTILLKIKKPHSYDLRLFAFSFLQIWQFLRQNTDFFFSSSHLCIIDIATMNLFSLRKYEMIYARMMHHCCQRDCPTEEEKNYAACLFVCKLWKNRLFLILYF